MFFLKDSGNTRVKVTRYRHVILLILLLCNNFYFTYIFVANETKFSTTSIL